MIIFKKHGMIKHKIHKFADTGNNTHLFVSCLFIFTQLNKIKMKQFFTFFVAAIAACLSIVAHAQCDATVNYTAGYALEASTAVTQNYQWVDCNNNFTPIVGETSSSFYPFFNGNYAVIVTGSGCSDTSICFAYTACDGFGGDFTVSQDPGNLFELSIQPNVYKSLPSNQVRLLFLFGDGSPIVSFAAGDTVSHTYTSFGTYEIYMETQDSTLLCYDFFTDSITIDSTGSLMMRNAGTTANGFRVSVLPANFDIVLGSKPVIQSVPTMNSKLELYPNPTVGHLTFELPHHNRDAFTIQVLDLNGRIVLQQLGLTTNSDNRYNLEVHDLSKGMYYLRYLSDKETIAKPFVKQ